MSDIQETQYRCYQCSDPFDGSLLKPCPSCGQRICRSCEVKFYFSRRRFKRYFLRAGILKHTHTACEGGPRYRAVKKFLSKVSRRVLIWTHQKKRTVLWKLSLR